jgi:hypothetical protein
MAVRVVATRAARAVARAAATGRKLPSTPLKRLSRWSFFFDDFGTSHTIAFRLLLSTVG